MKSIDNYNVSPRRNFTVLFIGVRILKQGVQVEVLEKSYGVYSKSMYL